MGFFKNVREATAAGREAAKGWDPAAQMRQGMEAMRDAQAMIAQQTMAATAAAGASVAATAVVDSVHDTGMLINNQPSVRIELTVFPPNGVPTAQSVTTVVAMSSLALLTPGRELRVRIDPANPAAVWIDWANLP